MTALNESSFFTEENSAEIVIARNNNVKDERLNQIMESITRHLHAAVKEIEPSQEEWMAAIQFLTSTGQMCDSWRQEYILLSDVMGVSMLVDSINSRRPIGATENTVLGPFHLEGAPDMEFGANICLDIKGEPMVVNGRITDVSGRPLEGVKLDVWQANDEGFYDVQQKGVQPDFNLRGVFHSRPDGSYLLIGVKPRHYPIPNDGPVGQLLNKLGRNNRRPAHLHFIISAEGYQKVTTHIFVSGDPYINDDAVFGVKESLLRDFVHIDDEVKAAEYGVKNPFYKVEFNVVLAEANSQ
jgi:hydroxyquinol 1,2-dioxygenase|tara:strand:+ start:14620 stop:15510 length:891 start_codon:yes stop_codon:yes gene_type:complete